MARSRDLFIRAYCSLAIAIFLAYAGYYVHSWMSFAGSLPLWNWIVISTLVACCVVSALSISRGGLGVAPLLPPALALISFAAIELVEVVASGGDWEPFYSIEHVVPLMASIGVLALSILGWAFRIRQKSAS